MVLGIFCGCQFGSIGRAQDNQSQGVPKTADKKQDQNPKKDQSKQKADESKDQKKDEKKESNQGGGTAGSGDQKKDTTGQNSPNSSRLQVLYPASDIVIEDGNCESRVTPLAVRATAKDVKLQGPVIVGGGLQDKDSSTQMPAQMFQLLQKKGAAICGKYSEITPDANTEITDDLSQAPVYIGVRNEWGDAGVYTGNLWIAAKGDSAAQSVALKVTYRPWTSWLWGITALVIGAGISWYAVVYVVRQRQMAANLILIARLRDLLDSLTKTLQGINDAGAPSPQKTLQHIQQIRDKRLRELLDDKELSVLAGITVPPTGTVTVIDDTDGVNLIVQNGFERLYDLWKQSAPPSAALTAAFAAMDSLGAVAQPLAGLDQKIQNILNTAPAPAAKAMVAAPVQLPSEEAVIHQMKTGTVVLDVISFLTVVVLGIYVLIWKNPGFGSVGNYIEAFLWGLGLKLGGDVTKLGPSDVRTAFGIKVPSSTS